MSKAADDQRSDGELVAAINAGDWTAFEVLYFRHRDWAYRLAWRFSGDEADAQDVVQEVFVYLARKFPGLQLTAGLTTLLYPAVKHTAITLRKKRQRMVGGGELGDLEMGGVGDKGTEGDGELREQLREVMRGLSEEHREVVLMRFVDEMSLDEIAAALGVPTGTVKSRLHHAVKGLRADSRVRRWFEV
ncbi:MAG: sigma-70 family RNA polymerase sigma factor [Phycisphaerales bacterium]|nr:sigma-70 family RNA polymerase sigma factor [Phycisphaerales bacterium]